jgi:hypothetical protein
MVDLNPLRRQIATRVENLQHRFRSYPDVDNFLQQGQSQLLMLSELIHGVMPKEGGNAEAIRRTFLFHHNGIRMIGYESESDASVQFYGTIYHLPIGTHFFDGRFQPAFAGNTLLGYPIDFNLIGQTLADARKLRPIPVVSQSWYTLGRRKKQRKYLLWGCTPNIGHHLWNEQTGLDLLFEEDLLNKLDGIMVGPYDFFDMAPLFEQHGIPVIRQPAFNIITETVSSDDILLASTQLVFTASTRDRVISWVMEQKNTISAPRDHSPVIAFQLRQHSRRWLSEEKGLGHLIRTLAEQHPNAAFIIDGFSSHEGQPKEEQKIIALEKAVADRIIGSLDKKTPIYSTVGLDVRSKVFLLGFADMVFSPIGSAGIIAHWLLKKFCIFYGPHSYYNWTSSDSKDMVEDAGEKSLWLDERHIHVSENGSDFDLDWRVLADTANARLRNTP